MCLRVSGIMGLLSPGGRLCRGIRGDVCRQGFCGPILFPGALGGSNSPESSRLYKWIVDAIGLLNDFVKQVVNNWRDSGLHRWAT